MRESVKQLESRARELRKIALEMAYVSGTEGACLFRSLLLRFVSVP